ncbi:MAG: cytochrome b/b6 domain-containing protein [Dechloromonas sp.]|nr:cytochrome b/b6 domain-containing protein [Dechloromonas sp.]
MTHYRLPAIVLHWLHAILVIGLLWLGWTMIDLPKGAERTAAYTWHKSLGLLVLMLAVLRLYARRRQPPPAALPGPLWQQRLAHATHRALYAFLLLAPLAGYLASSFSPYPLKFFGLAVAKLGWPDEGLNGVFKLAHLYFVWGGALLIGLHVLGALKPGGERSAAWRRMLPGRLFKD